MSMECRTAQGWRAVSLVMSFDAVLVQMIQLNFVLNGMVCVCVLMCTGAGEEIVRASLARTIGDVLDREYTSESTHDTQSGGVDVDVDLDLDVDTHEVLRRVLIDEFWGTYYHQLTSSYA